MTPRRVLLVAPHYPPRRVGGAEVSTERLARWLVAADIAVHVLTVETVAAGPVPAVSADDEAAGPIHVRRLHIVIGPGDHVSRWFAHPRLRVEVDRMIAEVSPDLVHVISGYLWGTSALDAARASGCPVVVTLTDFWSICPTIQLLRGDGSLCDGPVPLECARCLADDRRRYRAIDRAAPQLMRRWWRLVHAVPWLRARLGLDETLAWIEARHRAIVEGLNRADHLIGFTHFAARLHAAHGISPHRLTVIPNAAAADLDPAHGQPPPDRLVFLYLGQIVPIKGIDVLIRAFVQARRHWNTGRPVTLTIRGPLQASPPYVRTLRRLARGAPEITFDGPYEHRQVLAIASAAHVVVVPSLWHENAPFTVLEAFRAGRPVVGARVGGIAEVVDDGVNGLLFERGRADDLARVLTRLVEDPSLVATLTAGVQPPAADERDFHRAVADIYAGAIGHRAADGEGVGRP